MILIFISLIFIFIFAYVGSHQDIMAPGVLLSFSFVFSTGWALVYAENWSLSPSIFTVAVLVLGTLEFVCITTLMEQFSNNNFDTNRGLKWNNLSLLKLLLIAFIELIVIAYIIHSIKQATGVSKLSDAIYTYRRVSLFSTNRFDLPKLVFIGNYFCNAVGYFFGYFFVKKAILLKKVDFSMILIIILSAYESTLFGSRTGIFTLIFALVTYWYCLFRAYRGLKFEIKTKYYFIGLTVVVVFLSSFKQLAVWLGRDITKSAADYLAIYAGAEIKNLDTFIQANSFPITTDIFHSQTLQALSKFLGKIFGAGGLNYKLDLPFQTINGYDLGNVYTMYYQFLYDLGYVGVFLFVLFFAVFIQFIYIKVKDFKDNGRISYSILVYGYLTNTLILAFFSNKFYEAVVNPSFIYVGIFWVLLNLFMFGRSIFSKRIGFQKK